MTRLNSEECITIRHENIITEPGTELRRLLEFFCLDTDDDYLEDCARIVYNSPVTLVDTSGIKPVAIDANGVYHYADAILVTVSVGVLQAEIIDFVPDLPAAKVTAYNTLGMTL